MRSLTLDEPDPVLSKDCIETCGHTGTGYRLKVDGFSIVAHSITFITLVEYNIGDESQFDRINFIEANE